MPASASLETEQLKRAISLPMLAFYGIGTILGAGIYVLVGKVAGYAGMYTPIAFLLAAILAGFSAFSYAELSVRFPKSAGEAIYIQEGLKLQPLSVMVGLMIVAVGVTSTATLINGLTGYAREFILLPDELIIIATVLIMGAVVAWGISESVVIASLMTILEIIGLVIILWVARDGFSMLPARGGELLPPVDLVTWGGVLLGSFVAFYAFIGFEDIVNVAEEVKSVERNLPRAIIIALVVTTLFYILVSLVSILVVSPAELAKSDAPLAFIYQSMTGSDDKLIPVISVVSILNGALIQIVMASRVLYGMSRRKWLPAIFGHIHHRRRTPLKSTLIVTSVILVLSLLLPLLSLAKLTSFITLTIFTLINLALLKIKLRGEPSPGFTIPLWVPVTGFVLSFCFLGYQLLQVLIAL